jgi:hypothetical protein
MLEVFTCCIAITNPEAPDAYTASAKLILTISRLNLLRIT